MIKEGTGIHPESFFADIGLDFFERGRDECPLSLFSLISIISIIILIMMLSVVCRLTVTCLSFDCRLSVACLSICLSVVLIHIVVNY